MSTKVFINRVHLSIRSGVLPVKALICNGLALTQALLIVLSAAVYCLPASAQQNEQSLNISFQVYIWRTSTSIEKLVGNQPPTTRAPALKDDAAGDEPPPGDVTALYVAPEIKFFSDGHSAIKNIRAAEGRLSRPQNYTGTNPLKFFREQVVNGETIRLPLGEVSIDEKLQRAVLLFLPMPGGSPGYRILPLENSPDRVPPGDALIYNFTGGDLAIQVDKDQFVLAAGDYRRISLRAIENFRLPVQLAMRGETGEWEVLHRQNSIVDPSSSLLFLVHRAEGSSNLL